MNKDVTIVITDDDEGHFILAKYFLDMIGITNEIIWHMDGQMTVDFFLKQKDEIMKSDKKHLLLLDIRMPVMDGIEVLETLKKDNILKNIPVIMVTTSSDPANIKLCKEIGCFGYAVKPLGEEFTSLIKKVAEKFT